MLNILNKDSEIPHQRYEIQGVEFRHADQDCQHEGHHKANSDYTEWRWGSRTLIKLSCELDERKELVIGTSSIMGASAEVVAIF
ncbi:uncharacterized protein EAF02_000624 [Botrytis sinoallii]|uniref:uncharacterized protein n=1 Tax=Botrytis sinoallii TaxID=1463999 RepID=UPI0019017591|nr:uncharacterized protein EAF02_000624 [Botrytis sinoallii]KAF7893086.1 hypothetical protein EAF02_000624 [Botrytis sinoallii]